MRAFLDTSWGTIRFDLDEHGVIACDLPMLKKTPPRMIECKKARSLVKASRKQREVWAQTVAFVEALLRGVTVDRPPFHFPDGSPFQQEVWHGLLTIPMGETVSYAELARHIGSPRAARAVGGACGANPLPLIIPCHRVLAAGQKLGGFSAGLPWKKCLLEQEHALS